MNDKKKLINSAKQSMKNAYAPYSKFRVGAALLTISGKIYTGCNIENASFGLTLCAERVALFKAVSGGAKSFKSIAIVATKNPVYPCGACRQALYEFAPGLKIFVLEKKRIEELALQELLPLGFHFI
ncbi:MAG TPA: cytidine deaminase [bacterium]